MDTYEIASEYIGKYTRREPVSQSVIHCADAGVILERNATNKNKPAVQLRCRKLHRIDPKD